MCTARTEGRAIRSEFEVGNLRWASERASYGALSG